MREEEKISKCYVNFLFAIGTLALAASIVLTVMLIYYQYVGFTGTIPISVTACNNGYFTNKYIKCLTNIVEVTFVSSLFAILMAAIIFIILLIWVIAICKGNLPHESISQNSKVVLYILSSLLVLSSIVPIGYHLTYILQLSNCTNTNDSNQLLGIFIVAAALFILALILWILLLIAYNRTCDSQQKYRDVVNTQQKQIQPYQPRKYIQSQKQVQMVEQTKENLMQSPKKPYQNYYLKQPDNQPMPNYQLRPYSKYQSPNQNVPPYLEPKKSSQFKPSIDYITSQKYLSPAKEEVVYSRTRKDPSNHDEEALRKEQKKYLSKYGGSILPSSGVEQKQSRQNRLGSDYFRSNDPKKQSPQRSASKGDREGVLLNYIRGKWAN